MADLELPTLTVEAIAALVVTSRPLVTNRDPSPDEADVPLATAISLELVDRGPDGIARAATRLWINDVLAFDGGAGDVQAPFAGPRASVSETSDTLRVTLDPQVPFATQASVAVHVVTTTTGGAHALDETYAFTVEDRTAPRLVAAVATSPRTFRLAFDEPVLIEDVSSLEITALDTPAVPLGVQGALASGTLVDLTVEPEMTPDARYRVRARSVSDVHGNACSPPFDVVVTHGFRPARPETRRFDLWSMLPKYNRRADVTGDLARFVACLQEILDLLLAEIDRVPDIFDIERAPAPFLDAILKDLGNPFPFELDDLGKRRLASVLVAMYRQKGTAVGVRNTVRFFLGVDIEAITELAATALALGDAELGVDWELGPSQRFARYAFDVKVGRVLTPTERKHLRAIVEYLKPAHTHLVSLIEPVAPVVPDHWEVGWSELTDSTLLH